MSESRRLAKAASTGAGGWGLAPAHPLLSVQLGGGGPAFVQAGVRERWRPAIPCRRGEPPAEQDEAGVPFAAAGGHWGVSGQQDGAWSGPTAATVALAAAAPTAPPGLTV